jgi:hypothetical protein
MRHSRIGYASSPFREALAMSPEDIPTINAILVEYGVSNLLDPEDFASMLEELKNRENAMVTDLGPRIWARNLDRIVSEK